MRLSCVLLLLTLGGFTAALSTASLTIAMSAGPDVSWSYLNQSAKGSPSQLVPLPDGTDVIPDCPVVSYGVGGCRNPTCYDALLIRQLPNGIASLLNTTSNFNNAVGHTLVITPTSVVWLGN